MLYLNKENSRTKKNRLTLNLFIRSLLFSIYSLTTIVIYSIIVSVSRFLPLRYRHAIIRTFLYAFMFMLKFLCSIDCKIEGLENIPKDRNGIVMSKHQSTWETFYLPLLFHDPAPIAKRELLWIPFFGWGLAAAEPITIDRNNKTSSMQQIIRKGRELLQQGRWIMLFPEGTRVPYGQVGQYRLGGARLAQKTGYPVIPVAHNAGLYWPRRSLIKYPGTIRMVIGPIIESEGRSAEEIITLTKDWIETTMTGLEHPIA